MLYHHSLLLEQRREWGVDISAGEINHFLKAGLTVSDYVTIDDSGARHKGSNGYVTQIGNYHQIQPNADQKNRDKCVDSPGFRE